MSKRSKTPPLPQEITPDCPGRGQARCLTCAHYIATKRAIPEDIQCPYDLEDEPPTKE